MPNPDRQSHPTISKSEQVVQNLSFDELYKVTVVLPLTEYSGALYRLQSNAAGALKTDGSATTQPVADPILKKRIDDTSTTNVIYIGETALGTATSVAAWRIKQISEVSGVVITYTGTGFDTKWNDRLTASYS